MRFAARYVNIISMKKSLSVFSLLLIICFVIPFFVSCNNNVTISYIQKTENKEIAHNLPKDFQHKLKRNSKFVGLEEENGLIPVEYRVYSSDTEFYNIFPNHNITEKEALLHMTKNF